MTIYSNYLTSIVIIVAFSFCLSSCEPIIGNIVTPAKDREREVQLNHQNPSRMIEKIDQDRSIDNSQDIHRQKQKEDAARVKQLNELIDKNLFKQ